MNGPGFFTIFLAVALAIFVMRGDEKTYYHQPRCELVGGFGDATQPLARLCQNADGTFEVFWYRRAQ